MSRKEDKSEVKIYSAVVAFIALLIVIYAIAGCSPRIIENTVIQHDTTKVVQLDSVWQYQRDSIFVKEKGDTVFQYVERIRYRDRWRVDTCIVTKVDSVAVERIKEVNVEKPLSWWQRVKLGGFWPVLLLALGLGIWTFRKPLLALIKSVL